MNTSRAKHIVLIVFDFMGYGDVEPFGQCEIRTPNIRQLAEQGIRYTDCYAPAPICSPSRAAMLTGRYPCHLGVERNFMPGEAGLQVSEKTLARYFKDAKFHTALYGKWHLGNGVEDNPNAHGFDDFQSPTDTAGGTGPFYVSGYILRHGTGKGIGTFHCWGFIRPDGLGVVNQEFDLDGRGKILIAGVESDAPRAVTGGTDEFKNARGQAHPDIAIFNFVDTGKFRISFDLVDA